MFIFRKIAGREKLSSMPVGGGAAAAPAAAAGSAPAEEKKGKINFCLSLKICCMLFKNDDFNITIFRLIDSTDNPLTEPYILIYNNYKNVY